MELQYRQISSMKKWNKTPTKWQMLVTSVLEIVQLWHRNNGEIVTIWMQLFTEVPTE